MKTAYAKLRGFEVIAWRTVRMFREGHARRSDRAMVWASSPWSGSQSEITGGRHAGEIRLIDRQFDTNPF